MPAASAPFDRFAARGAAHAALMSGEAAFMSEVRATRGVPAMPRSAWLLYMVLLVAASSVAWSSIAGARDITHAQARVVPIMSNQLIANPEGGVLRELRVQDGARVSAGQVLAQLDSTALEAEQQADKAARLALHARIARLGGEASGKSPVYPKEVAEQPALVLLENTNFSARKRALEDELAAMRRRIGLLASEVRKAETLRDAGQRAPAEADDLKGQLDRLRQQNQEHNGRFRTQAGADLVQAQQALDRLDAQIVERADALRRTTMRSPVGGLVTRMQPLKPGDTLAAAAPLMEIVPVSSQVLIEARIEADQVGLLRIGQQAAFRLSGREADAASELIGTIEYISPEASADPAATAQAGLRFHRAIVRAERSSPALANAEFQVLPGMTGALEVRTGASVLGLLRLPIVKAREVFARF
jgi:membrane fusion protein, adhesin transport system